MEHMETDKHQENNGAIRENNTLRQGYGVKVVEVGVASYWCGGGALLLLLLRLDVNKGRSSQGKYYHEFNTTAFRRDATSSNELLLFLYTCTIEKMEQAISMQESFPTPRP